MRKLVTVAATGAALLAISAPASASVTPPPLDPVTISNGCPPDYPCTPHPTVTVDKTYPSRLVTWAKGSIPPVTPPPTDPLDGGPQCQPDYPCDPQPYTIDKTYPSRVVAWAKSLIP